MKIGIKLNSKFYSVEQNLKCFNNPIFIDWDLPFLPREEELFDCDTIIGDKMPNYDTGLAWDVYLIEYTAKNGKITPILNLRGE